ncbi:hypothetical protein I546_3107 [Mycobacterium kansasii 732]|nr:hypothetical protein I546_3107 [Mycobacterium kansasii 732]
MTFWLTGDEEHDDKRFDVEPGGILSGLGFYTAAGSWCRDQIRWRPRSEIPDDWLIPDAWIKAQRNGARIAKALAANGILRRAPGGYGFAWIRKENTVAAELKRRDVERGKWHAKQAKRKRSRHGDDDNSQGESSSNSPGVVLRGEFE